MKRAAPGNRLVPLTSVLLFLLPLLLFCPLPLSAGAEETSADGTAPTEDTLYCLREIYSAAELWNTPEADRNAIAEETWGACHKTEWPVPTVRFGSPYSYDAREHAVKIECGAQKDNYFLWSIGSGPGRITDPNGCWQLSFQVWYEEDSFAGLRLCAGEPIAEIDPSGCFWVLGNSSDGTPVSLSAGQLTAGWNTVAVSVMQTLSEDGGVTDCALYFALNPQSDRVITAASLEDLPAIRRRTSLSFFASLTDLRLCPTEAGEETAPASLTLRAFRTAEIRPTQPATLTFETLPELNYEGYLWEKIVLPVSPDIAYWEVGGQCYSPGDSYEITAAVTFSPVSYVACAYEALAAAMKGIGGEESATDLPARLETLKRALENSYLDVRDERYLAAEQALRDGVRELADTVAQSLAAANAAPDIKEKYSCLRAAIACYRLSPDLFPAETAAALSQAVSSYNTLVTGINLNHAEAVLSGSSLTADKPACLEIRAALTDIQSKVHRYEE